MNNADNKNDKIDNINSIIYMFNKGETLVKGEGVENAINRHHDLFNNIKVKKSGKEVKQAIKNIADTLFKKKEVNKLILMSLSKDITEQPTESMNNDYNVREFPNIFEYIPVKYDYAQIYNKDGQYIEGEQSKFMQKYNKEAYDYIENCVMLAKLRKTEEYINENKSYTITPTFALKLGL